MVITSSVSSRGYRDSRVCVWVCLLALSHSRTVWCDFTKFGTGIGRDDILDDFDGQGLKVIGQGHSQL